MALSIIMLVYLLVKQIIKIIKIVRKSFLIFKIKIIDKRIHVFTVQEYCFPPCHMYQSGSGATLLHNRDTASLACYVYNNGQPSITTDMLPSDVENMFRSREFAWSNKMWIIYLYSVRSRSFLVPQWILATTDSVDL